MELLKKKCPKCKSQKIRFQRQYPTKNHGTRTIYKCEDCFNNFSETKNTFLQNLKKPISLIWQVIKARTEGMGVNATARTFNISKNTFLDWETKFTNLFKILFIYSLVQQFLKLIIEGDEVPPPL